MGVDWFLNGIQIEKQHYWVNIWGVTFYALCNFSVVMISGKVVYPGLNWTTWLSWLLVVLGYPASYGLWWLLWWCTSKKVRKLRESSTE
jgi:hypothetical protein